MSVRVPADQLQLVARDLEPGQEYQFAIRAWGADGPGEVALFNPVIPLPHVSIPSPFVPVPREGDVTPHVLSWARWRDFEFGDGTPWEFSNPRSRLALAALPGVRTGDTERNQQDGLYPGEDYLEGRSVSVELRRLACSGAAEAVEDLVRELWVSRGEGALEINGTWTLFSRPRLVDPDAPFWYTQGGALLNTAIRFDAADPLIYGAEQDSGWVGLASWEEEGRQYGPADTTDPLWDSEDPVYSRQYPQDGSGWAYPGEGRRGGLILATNDGYRPSWRIKGQIVGPCLNPQLVHVQLQERLALNIELLQGQSIELDWWAGTILLGGANRYLAITTRSRWWPLLGRQRRDEGPRLNTIRFLAARFDREARARLWWRSAD